MIEQDKLIETNRLIGSVSHKHARSSVTRPERLYLTPSGFVLKIRTVSNLLLVHLRRAIEQDFEKAGLKPQPPVEVIDMPGPMQGQEEVLYEDPGYKAAMEHYEDEILKLLDEKGGDFLLARGIVDVGFIKPPSEHWLEDNEGILSKAWDALGPEAQWEAYEEYPDWKQEAQWFREENADILDLPASDMVLFAAYIATASQNELTKLYNAIMETRSTAAIFRLISNKPSLNGALDTDRGLPENAGPVAVLNGPGHPANGEGVGVDAGPV